MEEKGEITDSGNAISGRLIQALNSFGYDIKRKGTVKELQKLLSYNRPDNIYNATNGDREPGMQLLIDLSNLFDKFPVGWIITGKSASGPTRDSDVFRVEKDRNNETKEIIRLRAVTNILVNYILEIKSDYYQRPLEGSANAVVDEYERDLSAQLLQLRTEQL